MSKLGFEFSGLKNGQENLVLLHSSMSSLRQWLPLMEQLKNNYNFVAFDLIGYGTSNSIDDFAIPYDQFNLHSEVEQLMPIIDKLFQGQDFHLIGHSYGGAVSTRLVLEYPEKVKSLSVFEPVLFCLLDKTDEGWLDVDSVLAPLHGLMAAQEFEESARRFINYWNGEGAFDQMPIAMQQQFTKEITKVMLDFQGLTDRTLTPELVANIAVPTLLMKGNDSRKSTHRIIEVLESVLPNHKSVNLPGGHMAPISHRQPVNDAILEFLDSL